jgi:hypothetical protein
MGIWGEDWFFEHKSHLYVAFRGCSHLFSNTKTFFEHESNEDIGFWVRLRDMTDQEKQAREKVNVKY